MLFFVVAMLFLCGSLFSGMLTRRLFLVVLTVVVAVLKPLSRKQPLESVGLWRGELVLCNGKIYLNLPVRTTGFKIRVAAF